MAKGFKSYYKTYKLYRYRYIETNLELFKQAKILVSSYIFYIKELKNKKEIESPLSPRSIKAFGKDKNRLTGTFFKRYFILTAHKNNCSKNVFFCCENHICSTIFRSRNIIDLDCNTFPIKMNKGTFCIADLCWYHFFLSHTTKCYIWAHGYHFVLRKNLTLRIRRP